MNTSHPPRSRIVRFGVLTSFAVLVTAFAMLTGSAAARLAVAPVNSSLPTISGSVKDGHKLTAGNGTWANTPTGFAYQWQQCSGTTCTNIAGATTQSYTPVSGDAGHTLIVIVTASNADGNAAASSKASDTISMKAAPAPKPPAGKAPVNTVGPVISGTAKVGEELSSSTGTWTGAQSYGYQWERCDTAGAACASVAGATGAKYGVRTADVGHTMRVAVTATNASGSAKAVSSAQTAAVVAITAPVIVIKNHAPTISFVSLKRVGLRIYARFNSCDDATKAITVIQHDRLALRLGYTRRFSVAGKPCGTHARNWSLIQRFRGTGKYTVTLRAVDKSGASSRTVTRSMFFAPTSANT